MVTTEVVQNREPRKKSHRRIISIGGIVAAGVIALGSQIPRDNLWRNLECSSDAVAPGLLLNPDNYNDGSSKRYLPDNTTPGNPRVIDMKRGEVIHVGHAATEHPIKLDGPRDSYFLMQDGSLSVSQCKGKRILP